ncbi:flavin prenyltransferase UbiX [Candidatus Albibeggiatoa sp. nov. BB20]|uniref:flavin prenyltransferase UbiX n=1 Tax=Candidatus Albibeggiatoa sp. nov. BB20 TaxID=3162723 RepID=UPI003365B211
MSDNITLAMTGASGAIYGIRLLEQLLLAGKTVHFLLSKPARLVIKMELGLSLPSRAKDLKAQLVEQYATQTERLHVYDLEQWTAPIASGSSVSRAMVICPCTSGSLASIANGLSRNLIERAADVSLKERKQLILVHRETPLSPIHLQNMLTLSQAGAVILPASPAFYNQPKTIQDVTDTVVARILDHLTIEHQLLPRWGEHAE